MSGLPWEPDRDLTLEIAAALIELRFPEVDSKELRHLGSGWEFDALLTRDGWVFRFPRRSECALLFELEKPVLSLVASVMPAGTAVPNVELVGEPALGFPYKFAGHRCIPGVTADAVEAERLPVLARDIGAALAAIHSLPEGVVHSAGVRGHEPDEAGRAEWLERGFETAFALRGADPVLDEALRWLAEATLPTPRATDRRLIHQDLGPEHLIVDPTSGRLSGILDWTDAALGDPARDFVFLVTWRGWDFAWEVLRSYPLRLDEHFAERLQSMSRLLSIMWLATAHWQNIDLSEHLRGVRNVFAA